MIFHDIGLDSHEHSHNDLYIYGLGISEDGKDSMDEINKDNEHKIPHLRYYIGNLSLLSICQAPLLSVIN